MSHERPDTTPSETDPPITYSHRRWRSYVYLPHIDGTPLVQSITFRLVDSVPLALIREWRAELGLTGSARSDDPRLRVLQDRIERFEDSGYGSCHLRDPRIASIVEGALLHFDGERYRLYEWSVMPNHVHALAKLLAGHTLCSVVGGWKSFSGNAANRLLGRSGPFWMPDYFDRYIRDERHFAAARRYIRDNPVAAGLCRSASEWRWGSAWKGWEGGRS